MSTNVTPAQPTVLGAALRYKLLTLAVAALGAVAGIAYAVARSPQASATVSLAVHNPLVEGQQFDGGAAARYTADQAARVGSEDIASAAAARLADLPNPIVMSAAELQGRLTVATTATSNTLRVRVSGVKSSIARQSVDAVVAAYADDVARRFSALVTARAAVIDQQIKELNRVTGPGRGLAEAALGPLLVDRASLRILASDPSPGLASVSAAQVSKAGWSRLAGRWAAVGLLLGSLAGAALSFLRVTRRARVRRGDDAVAMLGVPLLGVLAGGSRSRPAGAESASIAASARSLQARSGFGVLAVIGVPGVEAVAVAAELAEGYRILGMRARVIDPVRDDVETLRKSSGSTGEHPRSVALVPLGTVEEAASTPGLLPHLDSALLVVGKGARAEDVVRAGDRIVLYGLELLGFLYVERPLDVSPGGGKRRANTRHSTTAIAGN